MKQTLQKSELIFTKKQLIVSWTLQLISAFIMFQTLFYKFSGSAESVYIFTTIGMEPWGRYVVGISELIASVLLMIPALAWMGALMGMGLMAGALFFHAAFLGIEVMSDGGQLFIYALITFVASAIVAFIRRSQIPIVNKYFV
jgi:uncharacterized membrane protein YphA (DoxX/SURF4 family)